jgi:hypothetical protein
MKKILSAIFLVVLISSCQYFDKFKKPKVSEITYLEKSPKLDIKSFFDGEITSFSITQDKNNKIISTSIAKINGKWQDNKAVIEQNFVNEIGKKDNRTWLLTLENDNSFSAVGHDVYSPAKGKIKGNAMQMIYTIFRKQNDQKIKTNYEENIYLVDENSAIGVINFSDEKGDSFKSFVSYKKNIKPSSAE